LTERAPLVDTHCHLDAEYFPEGPDAVIARARDAGVAAFVCIGVGGPASMQQVVELSAARGDVVATAGVHPHEASISNPALESQISGYAEQAQLVAIGEIGLDYHYDLSPREIQRSVFARLIGLAREVRLPIVVHTRNAAADTLDILEAEGAREVGGIIHCFSEDRAFAERALELDFDLSFSGIVTFKNARAIHDVAAWAPADRIMVETDSPYLAPVPHRGKRCEPAHVADTARRVAELRGLELDEIARLTTQNAVKRFGPPLAAALAFGQT
jgi:TatD DNase family protein